MTADTTADMAADMDADTDADTKKFWTADTDADTDIEKLLSADTDADTDMKKLTYRGHVRGRGQVPDTRVRRTLIPRGTRGENHSAIFRQQMYTQGWKNREHLF